MITRVFTAKVAEALQEEFEEKFKSISSPLVAAQEGLISVSIARPVATNKDEFLMISIWEDEGAIKKFAGEDWHQAHIPLEMAKYFGSYTLTHYQNIE